MYFEKLRDLLAETFDVPKDSITRETRLMDDLRADSLDVVDLLMSLEDEYDIVISDDDAQTIKTVGDVVDWLDKNLQ